MKKLLILIVSLTIGLSGFAQKHKENKVPKNKGEYKQQVKTGGYDDRNKDEVKNRNVSKNRDYNKDKIVKNLPAKVRSSFYRDYPNAGNVSWTKNNGYWIASFPNGLYRTSATYASNGERINGSSSRGTRRTYSNSQDGSIWDKILSKQ